MASAALAAAASLPASLGAASPLSVPVVSLSERGIRYVPAASSALSASSPSSAAAAPVARPPSLPLSQWIFPRDKLPPLAWSKARPAGAGLVNPSALCFMNAVLQALAYTPGFAEFLLEGQHSRGCPITQARREARRKKGEAAGEALPRDADVSFSFCVLCKLEDQVKSIHRQGAGCVENRFSSYVRQFVWKKFRHGRQEDAHEFLRYLLEALIRVQRPPSQAPGAPPSKKEAPPEVWMTSLCGQLFGGWLQSSIRCTKCTYSSVRFDPCLDVPVDLGRSGERGDAFRMKKKKHARWAGLPELGKKQRGGDACTLEKALHRFVQVEHLVGDNCYNCPQCKKKQPATKQLQIHTPPRVLVLPIKRFTVSGFPCFAGGFFDSSFLGKNHAALAFPSLLNLSPYMALSLRAPATLTEKAPVSLLSLSSSLSSSALSDAVEGAAASGDDDAQQPIHSPESCSTRASSSFASSPAGSPAASASPTPCLAASSPPLYQLYAVITHSGVSLSSGHYRCFVKMPNPPQSSSTFSSSAWLMADDETVRMVSETLVFQRLQDEAYLLFYSRLPSADELAAKERTHAAEVLSSLSSFAAKAQAPGVAAQTANAQLSDAEKSADEDEANTGVSLSASLSASGSSDDESDTSFSDTGLGSSGDSSIPSSDEDNEDDALMTEDLWEDVEGEREREKKQLVAFLVRRERRAAQVLSRRLRRQVRAGTYSLLRRVVTGNLERARNAAEAGAGFANLARLSGGASDDESDAEEAPEGVGSACYCGDGLASGGKRKVKAHAAPSKAAQAPPTATASLPAKEKERGKPRGTSLMNFHVVTAEDMSSRIAAARSYSNQYGVNAPGTWDAEADDEETSDGDGVVPPARRDELFERLQELQQPRSAKRERHDREYDRGKVKKVKRKEPRPTVGASVAHPSAASSSPSVVVYQRAAFDQVLAEKKNKGHRFQRLGAASGGRGYKDKRHKGKAFGHKGKHFNKR
ncbi:ubiquitin carboxyl-terminal hydrolase [Besnoitia besnoiti]|uniref:ubiquitinyl hydrolase 1 n=1 Tax=Besnoitia besnoiti TaxID=94643 RepID=A0A2A9MI54_BESBE|nr:ubiquitin carboxyl-terminal hydrolase [Besnoitia besnoiti]PFH35080.1 ubiquitin carboxyl-terminal hydrolase [Besnoitia besnoiti]